jgi:DNA-binding transcriptional MocR family regulator
MVEHMRKHANIIRPKFEMVEEILDRDLSDLEIGTWTKPLGGYFIMFQSLEGCAKDIVARAKKAGVKITPAGATWPYGYDPHDMDIRIAPTYPSIEDLETAMNVFTLCVRISSIKKILAERQAA